MDIQGRVDELVALYEQANNVTLKEEDKKLIYFGFTQAVMDSAWEEQNKVEHILIWSEDSDVAWGDTADFESEEEFLEQVMKEYESFDGKKCEVGVVQKQWMILTGAESLPSETLMPLQGIDIQMSEYYYVDVFGVEE